MAWRIMDEERARLRRERGEPEPEPMTAEEKAEATPRGSKPQTPPPMKSTQLIPCPEQTVNTDSPHIATS
ncbi:MAG: hypothetical protein ACI8Z5_000751 [Lentimonas sp.]|jgi:hypothetical protein